MDITAVLIIYGMIAIAIFLGLLLAEEDDEISLVEIATFTVFWPLYLLFFLPKIIWGAIKFTGHCFKQLFIDFSFKENSNLRD